MAVNAYRWHARGHRFDSDILHRSFREIRQFSKADGFLFLDMFTEYQ